jgi:ABC-type multidrug transport system ATPase subunit
VAWELSLERFGRLLFRLCVVRPCLPFDTPVTTTQISRAPHFAQVVQFSLCWRLLPDGFVNEITYMHGFEMQRPQHLHLKFQKVPKMARTRQNIYTPAPTTALLIEEVSKSYGEAAALDPISITIERGERVALIGHNGSGKTTMMRIAAGLLDATAGTVGICGNPGGSLPARASLSYIADQPTFYDDLTLWEHMEYVARLHGVDDWEQTAADLLGHLGIYDRADDMPNRFSRGLKQKSAIALGFIRPFELLLVDEPFVGLDSAGKEALLELLSGASDDGATVVVATHELSFVHTVRRIIALRDGRLVYDGGVDGIDVDGLVRTEDPAGEHDGEGH